MSNILIAFDESTTCTGYAVFKDEELIDYGAITQKSKNVIERVSEIAYAVEDLINRYEPNDIAIENVQITMSAPTAKSLMGLQLLIEILCYRKQIHCETIRTAHWRKVLGLSNSPKIKRAEKKKETIDYVENKYGIKIDKDDISDAIAIGTAYLLEKEN
ncbi:MAG: crossover junction endodeoxyribonuclease RuvC [Clostridia bacterium]